MMTLVCHRCGFTRAPEGDAGLHRVVCPADGLYLVEEDEHRRAPRDTYLGTVLGGRYPILGLVGFGGMGAVYRSIQPPVDRPVAVKVIHPRLSVDDTHAADATDQADAVAARFLREAKLIASLSHPNVVTMFDFGTEPDGTLYMVQELLVGDSLRRALPVLTPRALVAVVLELLSALGAAHALGLVHRDVKPENVMLLQGWTPDGRKPRVKLLDFGIARRVGADEESGRLTTAGAIFGTPAYMAPEQAQGSDRVDARADLYAVGVLLYEGLAGKPPFSGVNALALLVQVLAGQRAPLVARAPIPDALKGIVERALAKDPEARFQTADEMARALTALTWPVADAVLETSEMASGHRTLPLVTRPAQPVVPAPAPAAAMPAMPPGVDEGVSLEAVMARPPLAWRVGAAIAVGAVFGALAFFIARGPSPAAEPTPAVAVPAAIPTPPTTSAASAPVSVAVPAPVSVPTPASVPAPTSAPPTKSHDGPVTRRPVKRPPPDRPASPEATEEILAPPPR
jgi:hypothetical protein